MNDIGQQKVKACHLKRDAYLYVRQSTLKQVYENTESTQRQYGLRDRAVRLGWPAQHVHVIDSDLGQSGASSGERKGFQKLVAEVSLGNVGIVLGLEVSRLARNSSDWHRLIEICAMTKTLILDEEGVYDPTLFNDRLLLGLKGTMSEAELYLLRDRLRGGLLNKARRGELEIPIPTGFVYTPDGRAVLDPDVQVRTSIQEFFSAFRRIGSAFGVVRFFKKQGLKFPRRIRTGVHRGELVWDTLRHSQVLRILHNPRYAGAYTFGKTESHKTAEGRLRLTRLPREEWLVFIEDAHQGYISLNDFEENQELLKKNGRAYGVDRRTPPREGPALLQGMVICGKCGKRMTVRYHVRVGRRIPSYVCQRQGIEHAEPICQSIHGANIDSKIGEVILQNLSPHAMEVTLAVQEELQSRCEEVERLRLKEVERARYEADLAQRRYMQVDPSNRLVADSLEAEWNEKLRNLRDAHQNYERRKENDIKPLSEQERAAIMSLPIDFKKLWEDPRTPVRERKRLVQLLFEDITLLKFGQHAEASIRFKGGASESVTIELPSRAWISQKTSSDIVARIDNLLNEHTDAEIAEILNNEQLTTGQGKSFKPWSITRLRHGNGLQARYDRLRQAGMLTQTEIAKKYEVSYNTVRIWKDKMLIHTHRYDDKGRYLFDDPGDDPPVMIKGIWRSQQQPMPT